MDSKQLLSSQRDQSVEWDNIGKSKQNLMTRGPRTRGKVSHFPPQTQLPQVTQQHPQQKALKEKKKK